MIGTRLRRRDSRVLTIDVCAFVPIPANLGVVDVSVKDAITAGFADGTVATTDMRTRQVVSTWQLPHGVCSLSCRRSSGDSNCNSAVAVGLNSTVMTWNGAAKGNHDPTPIVSDDDSTTVWSVSHLDENIVGFTTGLGVLTLVRFSDTKSSPQHVLSHPIHRGAVVSLAWQLSCRGLCATAALDGTISVHMVVT